MPVENPLEMHSNLPFIRYRNGNRLVVPLTVKQSLKLASGNISDLPKLVMPMGDGMGPGIAIESTWLQMVVELVREFDRLMSNYRIDWIPLLQQFIEIVSKDKTCNMSAWDEVRMFLYDNVDTLSGWKTSPHHRIADFGQVKREAGQYYLMREGKTHIVIGQKTLRETRVDHIADSSLRSYGSLKKLIQIMAIVNLEEFAKSNPGSVPASMKVLLPEQGASTSFLAWTWILQWPYQLRLSKWRPTENLCDPDWLSNDFLAFLSEKEGLSIDDGNLDRSPSLLDRWQQKFGDLQRQTSVALKTRLLIGKEEETWFDFRGHTYRWINPTETAFPTVVAVHSTGENAESVQLRTFRFLNHLSFCANEGIEIDFWIECPNGINPVVMSPKRPASSGYPVDAFLEVKGKKTEKLDFALALYREGVSSGSPYYAFLNYYKILQIPYDESDLPKIKAWINSEAPKTYSFNGIDHNLLKTTFNDDVEEYLRISARNAGAHVSVNKNDFIIDPDDVKDQQKIRKDRNLAFELARRMIESGMI